jgi:hypothetical protein
MYSSLYLAMLVVCFSVVEGKYQAGFWVSDASNARTRLTGSGKRARWVIFFKTSWDES